MKINTLVYSTKYFNYDYYAKLNTLKKYMLIINIICIKLMKLKI